VAVSIPAFKPLGRGSTYYSVEASGLAVSRDIDTWSRISRSGSATFHPYAASFFHREFMTPRTGAVGGARQWRRATELEDGAANVGREALPQPYITFDIAERRLKRSDIGQSRTTCGNNKNCEHETGSVQNLSHI